MRFLEKGVSYSEKAKVKEVADVTLKTFFGRIVQPGPRGSLLPQNSLSVEHTILVTARTIGT